MSSCHIFQTTPRSNTDQKRPATHRNGTRGAHKSPPSRTNAPRQTASASRPLSNRPTGTYHENVPKVVQIARTYTGTPYRSGGNDKGGIDCSGLICSVYTDMGVKVPRISWQQSEFGKEIEKIEDIKPGDWIFFVPEGGKEGYVSHSGIVTEINNSQEIMFIHASSSKGVREDNLYSTYFKNRFVKAMRPF